MKVKLNKKSSLRAGASAQNDLTYSIYGFDSIGGSTLPFAVFSSKVEVLEYAIQLLPSMIKGRLHSSNGKLINWLYIYQRDALIYKINRNSLIKMVKVKKTSGSKASANSSPFLTGLNFQLKISRPIDDPDSLCPGGFTLDFVDGSKADFDFSYVDSIPYSPTEISFSCSGVNFDQWPSAKQITPEQIRGKTPLFSRFLIYISEESGNEDLSLDSVSSVECRFSDGSSVVLDADSATHSLASYIV